jgi:hypothetical protein
VYVDKLVKVAYENWESVVEYEGEALADVQAYPVKGMETYTQDPINGLSGSTFYLQGSHQEHIHLFSHTPLMNNHPVFSGPFDSDCSSLPSSVGVEISLQFNICILIYRVTASFLNWRCSHPLFSSFQVFFSGKYAAKVSLFQWKT